MDVDNWGGVGALPNLYAKTATGRVNVWICWVEGTDVVVRWGQMDGALQHARFKCEDKNIGRSNATTGEQQAVKEAIAKWKKQIKKKYFLSVAECLSTLNLKPMLAKSFHDRRDKIVYPVDVQPKLDGVRCLAFWDGDTIKLQSRGGDPYDVAHIAEQVARILPKGEPQVILDGELYQHGVSLQTIISLVKKPQEASANLGYLVYDIVSEGDPWAMRKVMLDRVMAECDGPVTHVFKVTTYAANDENEVKEHHDNFVRHGFEGAIVRIQRGLYKIGHRSSDLLKYKVFQDAEFPIVSWTVGKGKFENVPIFRCVTEEGREFDVAPKGTDAERLEMLQSADASVGKQLTVRFFDWTDDRIPHFPVGICVREPGT